MPWKITRIVQECLLIFLSFSFHLQTEYGLSPMLVCGLQEIIDGKTFINSQIPYTCEASLITPIGKMGMAGGGYTLHCAFPKQ